MCNTVQQLLQPLLGMYTSAAVLPAVLCCVVALTTCRLLEALFLALGELLLLLLVSLASLLAILSCAGSLHCLDIAQSLLLEGWDTAGGTCQCTPRVSYCWLCEVPLLLREG